MSEPARSSSVAPPKRRRAHRDLVSRVKSMWQRNQTPDALAFLSRHSSVRANRGLALELAYEEYCIRRDKGEGLDAWAFCDRFPSISRSLHRQIEVDEFVRNHPSIIGRQVAVTWPRRGDTLFEFVVVEEIGRGAFARAYLCAQPGLGNRQVVVKVSPGGAVEADTMGALDHPNIMAVYSVQENATSNLSGICMPFVGRSTLYDVIDVAYGQGKPPRQAAVILEASRALVRRGDRYHGLTLRQRLRPAAPFLTGALQLMVQIADALAHAHARGVLHGDLKPSNIVMSVCGMPLLVDFNLSQSRESGNLVTGGTLPYMAPEQIRTMLLGADDQDRVDQRSDIFSLGVILFELLTGRLPFEASQPEAEPFAAAGRMLDAQSGGVLTTPAMARHLEPGLVDLLRRCLAFDPQQRPATAEAVGQDLRRYLAWPARTRRGLRDQRPRLLGVGASLAAVLIGGLLWWSHQPPFRDRRFRRGVEAYQRQDYAVAIEAWNDAIAADTTFAQAYLARGCAALRRYELDKFDGWLETAFRDFTHAVRYGSGTEAMEARAFCLIQKNEYEMATRDLEQLHRDGHVSPASANNLAYCYEKLTVQVLDDETRINSLHMAADENLRIADSLAPDLTEPKINLAILELKRYRSSNGEYLPMDGLKAVRKAIELGSDDTATYFFAATLAGVVADELDDSDLLEECLDFLFEAVNRGHSIGNLSNEPGHPFDLLEHHPRFELLLNRKSNGKRKSGATRVIAPSVMDSRFSLSHEFDL